MKKNILIAFFVLSMSSHSFAQNANRSIRNGNKLYKQNNFEQSGTEYKKALSQSPENPVANYNLGNAQYRNNLFDEAVKSYEITIENSDKKPVKGKAFYNKGVALSNQQRLQESINAWKNALKLDPTDEEARENLQKALSQQEKQQKERQEQKKKTMKRRKTRRNKIRISKILLNKKAS